MQIMLLDIVFSLDSVITAVGMAEHLGVMVTAVVIAVAFMMLFCRARQRLRRSPPDGQDAGAGFLLLIGVSLVAEGLGIHIPKGYIYFAMAFSVFVEMLNLRLRRQPQKPVSLKALYRAK